VQSLAPSGRLQGEFFTISFTCRDIRLKGYLLAHLLWWSFIGTLTRSANLRNPFDVLKVGFSGKSVSEVLLQETVFPFPDPENFYLQL
jgi:hypothetical protein